MGTTMDVHYFLTDRITFIRQFYENASQPFIERQRRIEANEEPFPPKYDDSGEPPYLIEWQEAAESLQVLGYSCLSMLAGALHLYLETWKKQLPAGKRGRKKKGWLNQSRADFLDWFGIQLDDAPADLSLLEEVVLARNRIQHPGTIASVQPSYLDSDLRKRPHAFFVTDAEREMFARGDGEELSWLFQPSLDVTCDKLEVAIREVEKLAAWLEDQIRLRDR